jgi:hypothetical protein
MVDGLWPTHPTYRDSVRKRSPPWLQSGRAEKILYALAVQLDVLGDALSAGVKLRFPGLYSFESLPLLARERRIQRGRNETDGAYATRLTRWRIDHQVRGGPYALLGQLYTHYAPNNFPIDLVYYSGRRFSLAIDGTITRDTIAWAPDTDTARWARYWLIYRTDQWAVTPPTADEIEDLRLVPRQWNAAHAQGHIIVMPTTAELWNYPPGRLWNHPGTWNTSGEIRYVEVEPV